jgi:hypothetical protein
MTTLSLRLNAIPYSKTVRNPMYLDRLARLYVNVNQNNLCVKRPSSHLSASPAPDLAHGSPPRPAPLHVPRPPTTSASPRASPPRPTSMHYFSTSFSVHVQRGILSTVHNCSFTRTSRRTYYVHYSTRCCVYVLQASDSASIDIR